MADDISSFPLFDEQDHLILMHREVHFGGSFSCMLEYYAQDKKGVMEDFSLDRICFLAEAEEKMEKNLAPLLLTGAEAEMVAEAKKAYQKWKKICEEKASLHLLANLILSEEELPQKIIENVVAHQEKLSDGLIRLIQSKEYYNPLFPGYGKAPELAIHCLSKINTKKAIIPLFEAFEETDFFMEENIKKALKGIGLPAKTFLTTLLQKLPVNQDNERAAIILLAFADDEEVQKLAVELLQSKDFSSQNPFALYLVHLCAKIHDPSLLHTFLSLKDNPNLHKSIKDEVQLLYPTS